jgi:hypothetical protein
MSQDRSMPVPHAAYNRMPAEVCQLHMTVRVFRHTPGRVQMQIRNPKHYMTASLTGAQARELADWLVAAADEMLEPLPNDELLKIVQGGTRIG